MTFVEVAVPIAYIVAAIATMVGIVVYVSASLERRPDYVDGLALGTLAIVLGILWPIVVVGVLTTTFARMVWSDSINSTD